MPTPTLTPNERNDEPYIRITSGGAGSTAPLGELREIWQNRQIISSLVQRHIRLRYKGSFLGVFWSIAPPLIQVCVLTILLGDILGTGPHNLSAYIFCAYLPWIFINASLLDSSSSVLEQGFLLKKAYFPREILPISSVLANFIHFVFAVLVFLVYRYGVTTLLFGWPGLPPREILILPFVILDMLMLTFGLAFLLSAWTTFYEDVKYVVSMGLQLLFYALPIMYFAENIFYAPHGHKRWVIYHLYLANPMAWIVTSFKQMFFSIQVISKPNDPVIYSAPFDYRYFAITTITSFLIMVIGYLTFRHLKWKFAERA